MYKVRKNDTTEFIGQFGKCWIYLRDKFGQTPVEELYENGYRIERAKKCPL